jgi:TonB family protein
MKRTILAAALLLAFSATAAAQEKRAYCTPVSDAVLFPPDDSSPSTKTEAKGLHVYGAKEVDRKAEATDRPAPYYTEEAQQNHVAGTVKLKLVLCPDGRVQVAEVVKRLPDGLTEKAIEAAHKIKFKPAEKDGVKVAQLAVITYNFEPEEDEVSALSDIIVPITRDNENGELEARGLSISRGLAYPRSLHK